MAERRSGGSEEQLGSKVAGKRTESAGSMKKRPKQPSFAWSLQNAQEDVGTTSKTAYFFLGLNLESKNPR